MPREPFSQLRKLKRDGRVNWRAASETAGRALELVFFSIALQLVEL
jgi:hypothetical protein